MALIGNLENFKFLQLLQVIAQGRKTGRLTVQNRGQVARLYFEDGKVVSGSMEGRSSRLRESLLRGGQISKELDEHIYSSYRPVTDRGLALLLEDSGVLSREEMVGLEIARLRELIELLTTWDAGSFKFEAGPSSPAEEITVNLDLEGIIVDGGRRSQGQESGLSSLPDLAAILRFSRQHDEKAGSVRLGQAEWRVIAQIDGNRSIKMIAEATGIEDLAARKLAYGLINAGLVEVGEGALIEGGKESVKEQSVAAERGRQKKGFLSRLTGRIKRN